MKKIEAIFSLFFCFIASAIAADQPELQQLPKPQLPFQGSVKMEKSVAPIQLPTLNTLSLEPLQLNSTGLESALAESNQRQEEKKSPLPEWKAVREDGQIPLYAVTQFANKETGVELLSFGKDSDLPASLTEQVLKKRPPAPNGGSAPNQYNINGALVGAIFDALKISKLKNLYVNAFGSDSINVIPLKSVDHLAVSITETGDPLVQVSIPTQVRGKLNEVIVGIAYIGTENPFQPGAKLTSIPWEDTQPTLSDAHLDEIAAHLIRDGERLTQLPSSWKAFSMTQGSLIEVKAPFKGEQFTHTLTGYFWKKGAGVLNLLPIYTVAEAGYDNFPKPLLTGAILKGYKRVFLFGSKGMGDCGKFLIEALNGEVFQVPVRCKAVGC